MRLGAALAAVGNNLAMPRKPKAAADSPVNLREACIAAAHAVIAQQGLEALSLREVARSLGVSHQAPYKHYPSRDHLLAAVVARCFEQFADYLKARISRVDAPEEMLAMGRGYLRYASEHPLEYRLMFGTPWPDTTKHPQLVEHARLAFDVLCQGLTRQHGGKVDRARVESDALFIWASLHGLASITQSHAMEQIGVMQKVIRAAPEYTLARIGDAMSNKPQE